METNAKLYKQYFMVVSIALATMLNPLNTSMISLGLTRIQNDFHVSFMEISWFISLYYLVSAIAHPVMGKLTDIYGRRRLFLFGLMLIAFASLMAPFSPNLFWLTLFRAIQAWGSSTVFPAGMGLIREHMAESQGQALGMVGLFMNISAAAGPTLGGLLISLADWPVLFFVNIPFLLVSFLFVYKMLPKDAAVNTSDKPNIDYPGIILFSVSIVAFLTALLSLGQRHSYFLAAATILSLVLFVVNQKQKDNPFINVTEIVQRKGIGLVYSSFILINIIFYIVLFSFPTYLQQVLGFSAAETGLMMLSTAGFAAVVSPITGRMIDRIGLRAPLLVGGIVLAVGTVSMLFIKDSTGTFFMASILAAIGFSTGMYNIALQSTLYYFVPPEQTGGATGIFMTSRFVGTIIASGLLGLLFGKVINTDQFHEIAIASSIVVCLIIILIANLIRRIGNNKF